MKKLTKIFLLSIILLAAVLRLYKLDTIPPGVNRDEASIGFTAKSLAQTGKDEYGRAFPISFESFGDWKLPLYIYTTIPFVSTLGTSELAVRLPSALAGIATVVLIYFLAVELFASSTIGLLASFILAVSPWHMHISRVESEAIVATFFTVAATLLFTKAIRHKSLTKLVFSAVLLGLTYYTYHGNHVTSSLFIVGLCVFYWRDFIRIPQWWKAAIVGLGLVGIIIAATIGADHTKISGISIFGDPTVVHEKIELPRLAHDNPNSLLAKLEHNRVTYAVVTVFHNYLKSFSPEFLFVKGGGNSAHNIQGFGNAFPIEAPFLLLGVIWLFVQKKKGAYIILWWLAISAVAAAITKDAPHSNRMLAVVPALAITIAAGLAYGITLVTQRAQKLAIVLIVALYITSLLYYWDLYFIHFPKYEATNWGYAYKKLSVVLESNEHKHKQVIMNHPETSPYIYLLFYTNYDPTSYQKEAKRYPISQDGFTDVAGFGKYSFRPITWNEDMEATNTLIVTAPFELPSELSSQVIATIALPDSKVGFYVVDTKR